MISKETKQGLEGGRELRSGTYLVIKDCRVMTEPEGIHHVAMFGCASVHRR